MTDVPPAEEIIRYDKDVENRIATITIDRPDQLNTTTIGARRRYGDLIFKASIDDDVKVLVVRGVGDHLGTGADLDELMAKQREGTSLHEEFGIDPDDDVTMPPPRAYRAGAGLVHWYANPAGGCRSLQQFKKISILEVRGYCYGWHFYQCGDADMVIASDDALFGHPSFRSAGWGPRMWTWLETMGYRKFAEMVFTGRPFSAKEMADCNFVNSVVPRGDLEAEVFRQHPERPVRSINRSQGDARNSGGKGEGQVHGGVDQATTGKTVAPQHPGQRHAEDQVEQRRQEGQPERSGPRGAVAPDPYSFPLQGRGGLAPQ